MIFSWLFNVSLYLFMDLSNRFTLLVFRLNGNTNRLNAFGNRLPTVYNPFIFTRLTENH